MNYQLYFSVFKQLIYADLTIFRKQYLTKCIDIGIWVILNAIVFGYIMPAFGLTNFGVFQFGGLLAAVGIFEAYSNIVELISDFEGDRIINYSLTLPIPSWLAIISKAAYFSIIYFILAITMLPIGKLCLWNQLNIFEVNYVKLLLVLVTQSIFYGCFALWVSSLIKNMSHLGTVWARIIFPMWFMGGFQFSWQAMYSVMPVIASVNLLNPMIYITEAARAAIMGQGGLIYFWYTLPAILLFSALALAAGIHNLKKRLDFV